VRSGELNRNPLTGEPCSGTRVSQIRGQGRSWLCHFLKQDSSLCTIYSQRPLACRKFKCWDTKPITAIMGKDLLTRFDVIQKENLLPWIERHERECPLPDMAQLRDILAQGPAEPKLRAELAELVSRDLLFRCQAVDTHKLTLEEELFYFGRPLMTPARPPGSEAIGSQLKYPDYNGFLGN